MQKNMGSYLHDQLKPFPLLYFLHQVPGDRGRQIAGGEGKADKETEENHRHREESNPEGRDGGRVDRGRGSGTPLPTGQEQRPGRYGAPALAHPVLST